jgi:uncharacterized protein (TIGR03437 family)
MPRDRSRITFSVLLAIILLTGLLVTAMMRLPESSVAASHQSAQRNELEKNLSDKKLLLFRQRVFDPLSSESSNNSQPQTKAESTDHRYLIVQYDDSIRPQWADALRERGFDIVGYVPHNAYLVRVPLSQTTEFARERIERSAEPHIRWIGAYSRELRAAPELTKLSESIAHNSLLSSISDDEVLRISFTSFVGESANTLREALRSALIVTPLLETHFNGQVRGQVVVRRTELPQVLSALSQIDAIEWIEQARPHALHNDNGVRVVQTGSLSNDAPLSRRGLTGAGQVFGNADAGLDTDHAQFRLSSQPASQTLSFAVTAQSLINGLLPVNITNPNNKVLAYYLLGSGNLIDSAANPNGGRTLDPNQRDGGLYLNSVAYDDNDGYHGTHTSSVAVGRDFNMDGSGALPGMASRTAGDGIAPDARLVFQDIGHPSRQLPGIDFISQMLIHDQAYRSGVRVHNNSYGLAPPVRYDAEAADIDDVMWRLRDYTIFFSAGNDGPDPNTLGNAAKNNILVGATGSPTSNGRIDRLDSRSSRGPTLDGRIKPDIVAPGTVRAATEETGIPALQYGNNVLTSTTANDAAVNPSAPNNNRSLSIISGTSFAAPMVAGGALLTRQYFTDGFYPSGVRNLTGSFNPSNALIKAVILNSGRNLFGGHNETTNPADVLPGNSTGWGMIALDDTLYFAGDRRELKILADIWNGATAPDVSRPAPQAAIRTGDTHTYQLMNVSTVEPLRLTLVWSDPKAALSAQTALVNDLNLEVTDPQGNVYRGNVSFIGGASQPGSTGSPDNRNPVEAVYLPSPQSGTYSVRVTGANVPGSGQSAVVAQPGNQPIDANRQGYALIASGNFTAGARSLVTFSAAQVSGGVNADRYLSRNETVTVEVPVENRTVIEATSISVRLEVDSSSEVPANLVRINGNAPGQAATASYGDVGSLRTLAKAFQITLLDDGVDRAGKTITFKVTMTPGNGLATSSLFTVIVHQKVLTYRTLFEPTPDPCLNGNCPDVVVIPDSAWGLRADNPNSAPSGDQFAANWQLTTNVKGSESTASLSDPSGAGVSYGFSTTRREGGAIFDDARWWTTRKILLPGLQLDTATDKVANPSVTSRMAAAIDSFEVEVNADFTGDVNQPDLVGDLIYARVRTYRNTALSANDDTGFNSDSFTNLMTLDSFTMKTNGFRLFSHRSFADGTGVFAVDASNPDNSDVAFRVELQLRRNGIQQTGDGVYFDNFKLNLRVADTNVYAAPSVRSSVTVDAANYRRDIAPGQIVALFGSGLTNATVINARATSAPLPVQLGGLSVRVNGIYAPLFYVGANVAFQINFLMPPEIPSGIAFVEVFNGTALVTSEYLNVSFIAPAIFTLNANGQGQAAALNQDNSLNGDPALYRNARPERRGRYLSLYGTGQGATLRIFPSETSSLPLFITPVLPEVTVGGIPATVSFSGLAPGLPGVWQINVLIPPESPVGNAVPLTVNLAGRSISPITIAVN